MGQQIHENFLTQNFDEISRSSMVYVYLHSPHLFMTNQTAPGWDWVSSWCGSQLMFSIQVWCCRGFPSVPGECQGLRYPEILRSGLCSIPFNFENVALATWKSWEIPTFMVLNLNLSHMFWWEFSGPIPHKFHFPAETGVWPQAVVLPGKGGRVVMQPWSILTDR